MTIHQSDFTALLHFYQWAGIDIACQEEPLDRFVKQDPSTQPLSAVAPQQASRNAPSIQVLTATAAIEQAQILAGQAQSLEELQQKLTSFESCSLKRTAKNTCFADGTPHSPLMLVGEAPGSDEDAQGLPFVGQSGQLLDRILTAIGLSRTQVYIANIIPWRPPGNRTPSPLEIELCRPFIERQIALANPKILIALGGLATKLLTGKEGQTILKLRGAWKLHKTAQNVEIPVMPTLHPAYLLRNPAHKKFVWQDFLQVKIRLMELNPE